MKTREAEFKTDFPLLFRNKLPYGIETGVGWDGLLRSTAAKLEALIAKLPAAQRPDTYVAQIKQKFGGLRFYVTCPNEAMYFVIRDAEAASMRVCEQCGKPGRSRGSGGGWVTVACDRCKQP